MATYSELRNEILYMLDAPTTMTGDLRSLVDIKMLRVLERVVEKFKPRELLTRSSGASVTSSTTEISIASGFSVSDMAVPYGITVDKDTTDTYDPEWFEYVEYRTWLQLNNAKGGNLRPNRSFTIDNSDQVILRPWPTSSSETWTAYFWYYKKPTAIADSGEPELPHLHHGIIPVGTCLEFPQYFQGEKQILFIHMKQQYEEMERRLLKSRVRDLTLRPSRLLGVSSTESSMWPESRVDP